MVLGGGSRHWRRVVHSSEKGIGRVERGCHSSGGAQLERSARQRRFVRWMSAPNTRIKPTTLSSRVLKQFSVLERFKSRLVSRHSRVAAYPPSVGR